MSDAEREELHRRYLASGAAEDEAAYLAHRLREGQLEPTRLVFAAWLGYPAALALVGPSQVPPPHLHEEWVRFALHASEAALDRVLPTMPTKARYVDPPTRALRETREALRAWPPSARLDPGQISGNFWCHPKSFGFGGEPEFYRVLHACCFTHMAVHAPLVPDAERERERQAEFEQLLAFLRQRGRERLPEPEPAHTVRTLAMAAAKAALEGLERAGRLSPAEARAELTRYHHERLAPWLVGHGDSVRDLVSLLRPSLAAELAAAEAALAADPGERSRLDAVAALSARAGWTYEGRTLAEWCEEFARGWNRSEEALSRLERFGPKATLAILRAFQESGVSPEQQALELVAHLGSGALCAEAEVLERLERLNAGQHIGQPGRGSWTLIGALGRLGTPRAIAGLSGLLQGEGPHEHAFVEAAARALARVGPAAIPALERALDSPRGPTAAWAAVALAHLCEEHPRLLESLRAALRIETWHYLRERVVRALVYRGLQAQCRAELVELLQLEAGDYLVETLCSLLVREGWHEGAAARERLSELLAHEKRSAQAAAQAALEGRDPCAADRWRPPLQG